MREPLIARWHRWRHGEPLVRLSSAHRYTLEYVCACGKIVGVSTYKPDARLMRKLKQNRQRSKLRLVSQEVDDGAARTAG